MIKRVLVLILSAGQVGRAARGVSLPFLYLLAWLSPSQWVPRVAAEAQSNT